MWEREIGLLPKDAMAGERKMPTFRPTLVLRAKASENAGVRPTWSYHGQGQGVDTEVQLVTTSFSSGEYTAPEAFAFFSRARRGEDPPFQENRGRRKLSLKRFAPTLGLRITRFGDANLFNSATIEIKKTTLV